MSKNLKNLLIEPFDRCCRVRSFVDPICRVGGTGIAAGTTAFVAFVQAGRLHCRKFRTGGQRMTTIGTIKGSLARIL